MPNPTLRKRLKYLLAIFIIGIVGVYDNILNVCFPAHVVATELNPICRVIIERYGITHLVIIKSFGTIFGVLILCLLNYTRYRVSIIILFFLSLLLFFYLTFYCPEGDYKIRSILRENGPIHHVIEFYKSQDLEEAVERLINS